MKVDNLLKITLCKKAEKNHSVVELLVVHICETSNVSCNTSVAK